MKYVAKLTDEEIKKPGALLDIRIEDKNGITYCIRAVTETLG